MRVLDGLRYEAGLVRLESLVCRVLVVVVSLVVLRLRGRLAGLPTPCIVIGLQSAVEESSERMLGMSMSLSLREYMLSKLSMPC
jgi:hypothetical protein